MIKNLFIPEKVGNYYIFAKRVIGFDIGKTHIVATQAYVNGRSTTVEKIAVHTLPASTGADYAQQVSQGIKELLAQFNSYDEICTGLSSSLVFFKELTLPFTTRDKLQLVVPFEVESSLPFPLDQAVIDFVIAKKTQDSSDIMVAAVQKQYIAEHLSWFEGAGVQAHKIVVDLFSFYNLISQINEYAQFKGSQVFIDAGFATTRIMYVYNGQLKFIRTISAGIGSIIKHIGTETGMPAANAQEQLMHSGFEGGNNEPFSKILDKDFSAYLSQIQFTLQSFEQRTESKGLNAIVLLGDAAEIKNCATIMSERLKVPTTLFDKTALEKIIKFKSRVNVPYNAIISISIAAPFINEDFNLRQKEFSPVDESLFVKQFIVATSFIVFIFAILIGNNYLQGRKLNKAIDQGQKQAIRQITETLNLPPSSLNDLVEEAQKTVQAQDRIWSAFSQQTRSSFLMCWYKLTMAIDRDGIGLMLKKVGFNQEILRLQGEVKDIKSLVIFEEQLKQANLGSFTAPQEPKFDITITLKKNLEE
jgi:type IV pilus assembly protein PilM